MLPFFPKSSGMFGHWAMGPHPNRVAAETQNFPGEDTISNANGNDLLALKLMFSAKLLPPTP